MGSLKTINHITFLPCLNLMASHCTHPVVTVASPSSHHPLTPHPLFLPQPCHPSCCFSDIHSFFLPQELCDGHFLFWEHVLPDLCRVGSFPSGLSSGTPTSILHCATSTKAKLLHTHIHIVSLIFHFLHGGYHTPLFLFICLSVSPTMM